MKNLGKIFMIVLAAVLILFLLIGTALFFFVRNFDANKFKPQVIAAIKQALNRDVTISNLSLNFSLPQGILLDVAGLKILDDPKFSSEAFFSVDQIKLGVDIVGVVIKRQISVSSVDLIAPRVAVIRNEDGALNVQTLGVLQQGNKNTESAAGAASSSSSSSSSSFSAGTKSSMALAAILVQDIIVQNGTVSFKDDLDEAKFFEAKKVDLKINGFSLVRPFNFSLKAACFGDDQNVDLWGAASLDILNAALVLKNFQTKINLAPMDGRLIEGALPSLSSAKLKNPLAGQIEFSCDEARVGAKGFSIGKLAGKASGGEVNTAYLLQPLKNIEGTFEVVGSDLTVPEASCVLGSGRITGNAVIKDYLGAQDYKITVNVADLNIKEVVDQSSQEVSLDGLVSFNAALEGQGLSSLSEFKPAGGTADLNLTKGRLENINVLRIVLDKMSMIPDLVEKLEANLPEEYKAKLAQDYTELKVVKLDMIAQQGVFNINPADIETDVFVVTGNGTVDLSMNTEMQTKIFIAKELSGSMIKAVQELSLLADKDGRIVIPLMIEGKIPSNLTFMPDLEYLGRQLFAAEGREQLNKVLDKVFKKGESQPSGTEGGSGSGSNEADAAKEIIGNVLDSIFKK